MHSDCLRRLPFVGSSPAPALPAAGALLWWQASSGCLEPPLWETCCKTALTLSVTDEFGGRDACVARSQRGGH